MLKPILSFWVPVSLFDCMAWMLFMTGWPVLASRSDVLKRVKPFPPQRNTHDLFLSFVIDYSVRFGIGRQYFDNIKRDFGGVRILCNIILNSVGEMESETVFHKSVLWAILFLSKRRGKKLETNYILKLCLVSCEHVSCIQRLPGGGVNQREVKLF